MRYLKTLPLKNHQNQIKFLIQFYHRIGKLRIMNLFFYVLNALQSYLQKIKSLSMPILRVIPPLSLNLTFKIIINRLLITINRFNWGIKSNPKHRLTSMVLAVVYIIIWNRHVILFKHKLINSSKMETWNVRIVKRWLANKIFKEYNVIVRNLLNQDFKFLKVR